MSVIIVAVNSLNECMAYKRTGTSRTGDGLFLVTGTLDTDGTLGTLSGQSLCTFA